MDVEGRGKRPLRYCRSVQDGHTRSEQVAYQAIWTYARRHGRSETNGALIVDLGLSQLQNILDTDHKNVKRLLHGLEAKLALEVVRPPDYRLAIPTRYRIFNYSQILERRRAANMVWVIRTRSVRFVDTEKVKQLITEAPMGQSPVGEQPVDLEPPMGESSDLPVGQSPDAPTGQSPMPPFNREKKLRETITNTTSRTFPAALAQELAQWLTVDDEVVRRIWDACRKGTPDCTEEEVAAFCRTKQGLIKSGRVDNPAGLLIRSVPKFFENGGSTALNDYREEQARAQDRERKRLRQMAELMLSDSSLSEEEREWAQDTLRTT